MFYYKLGQTLLQIGTASLLQIGAAITNQGKIYYKLRQVLQIRAIITNWGIMLFWFVFSRIWTEYGEILRIETVEFLINIFIIFPLKII